MLNPYTLAGTLIAVVGLAGAWRAWLKQAAETRFMDRVLRRLGHVPPDTNPQQPLLPDDLTTEEFGLDYGAHASGVQRFVPDYSPRHLLGAGAWSWLVAAPGNEAPQ